MQSMLRAVPPMLWAALGIVVVFGILHLTGARDAVSVLSGTPVEGMSMTVGAPLGVAYVIAYFGAVLFAPILVVAAAISTALGRGRQRPGRARPETGEDVAQKVSDARRLPRPGVTPSSTPLPRSA